MSEENLTILYNLQRSNSNYLVFDITAEAEHQLENSFEGGKVIENFSTGKVIKILDLQFPEEDTEQVNKDLKKLQSKLAEIRNEFQPNQKKLLKFDQFSEYPNMRLLNDIFNVIEKDGRWDWLKLINEIPFDQESFNYHLNLDELEIHPIAFISEEDAKRVLAFFIQEKEDIFEDISDYPQHLLEQNTYKNELKNLIKNKLKEDGWDTWKESDLRKAPELREISKKYLIPKRVLIDNFSILSLEAKDDIETSELNIFNKLNEKKIAGVAAAEDINSSTKKDKFWLAGEFPLGSEFAINWLKEELINEDTSTAKWVMLLGAAGNGKSHMAYELKDQLQNDERINSNLIDIEEENGTHTFEIKHDNDKSGKLLKSVNDATVLEGEGLTIALNQYFNSQNNLLIAINKGVLVESQNFLQNKDSSEYPVKELIEWLLNPELDGGDDFIIDECSNNKDKGYIWKLRYKDSIELIVVQMDYGSLLETMEDPISNNNGDLQLKPYSIGQSEYSRLNSTAGKYVEKMLEQIKILYEDNNIKDKHKLLDQNDIYSPYAANINFLSENLEGYLEIIRSSEIASGYNLTYRDLNHAFVLSIIGHDIRMRTKNWNDRYTREERWFNSNKRKAKRNEGPYIEDVKFHQHLASKRLHMSIFNYEAISNITKDWSGFQIDGDDSFLKATALIDPVYGSATNNFEIVYQALSAMALEIEPSKVILDKDQGFANAWTDFDQNLEKQIMNFIRNSVEKPNTDKSVNDLRSWYGVYLYRLYALYKGISGHHEIIQSWKDLWKSCSRGNNPPDNLKNGLDVILFGADDEIYLPILANRANPINPQEIDKNRIAYYFSRNDFRFKWTITGEKISASISQSGESKSRLSIPINFDLCKEMMICKNGKQGFSNSTIDLFNRFERFRSSLLTNDFITKSDDWLKPQGAFIYNIKRKRIN